ncbi:MAG: glutathione S-transferase [Betaproteobacteria bacterium]|nr:glutathione S-transferase [Betaproteobacteria bacterium]
MKLYMNRASPFARKVRIAVRELGLTGRVQEADTAVSPVAANETLGRDNPLVKIPTLVTDEGDTLYDSRVICEYCDGLNRKSRLFPAAGPQRIAALRRQALADGALDAAVLCRYELALRPEALRWPDWIAGQKAKVFGVLDLLEAETGRFGEEFNIGQIGAACVCGYLDFRFPDWNWRSGRPQLAAWFERISRRPSVAETTPP